MGLAFDLVVSGVLILFALIGHFLAGVLFDPSGILFEVASQAAMFGGENRADSIYMATAVYIPALVIVLAVAWPMVRQYQRTGVGVTG